MTTLSLSTDYDLGTPLSEHHISSKRAKGNLISGIIVAIGSMIGISRPTT